MAVTLVESVDDPYDRVPRGREQLEEKTTNLLQDSKIDQELSAVKTRRSRMKKYKLKWMTRPMVMPETILGFLDEDIRENSIRYLSNFLVEVHGSFSPSWMFAQRREDLDNNYRAGYLVFNSCSTMCVLLQEILQFYKKMENENFDGRSIKRLTNVLILFQSVAANNETRQRFVDACVPNYLIPIILCESTSEVFEGVRIVALSIIEILCQRTKNCPMGYQEWHNRSMLSHYRVWK
ncbi:hypothetical protein Cni_G03850 [Canna indica]|uniref:Uncharacterized protein n=1 Tax=Canna indica TaxID=4628 RepID=A0AAQ3JTD3_9LILI|nr:hypothetical protein Cni_G03850 [Canna indica]